MGLRRQLSSITLFNRTTFWTFARSRMSRARQGGSISWQPTSHLELRFHGAGSLYGFLTVACTGLVLVSEDEPGEKDTYRHA